VKLLVEVWVNVNLLGLAIIGLSSSRVEEAINDSAIVRCKWVTHSSTNWKVF
jgi:hypothetical protein